MKTPTFFRRPALMLCLLGSLAPAAILVSGCGGGSEMVVGVPADYQPNADLRYSSVSANSNAYVVPITALTNNTNNLNGTLSTGRDGTQNLEFSGFTRAIDLDVERRIDVFLESPANQPFTVGQTFPLDFGTRNNIFVRQSVRNRDQLWQSDGGTATIAAIGPNSVSLTLTNARFVASPTFFASGTFLLNGTLGATSLRRATG